MSRRQSTQICATCSEPTSAPFCASCGEKQLRPGDERLGRFLTEQLQETLSADGKLWRTFKSLFAPGKLTAEYLAGRRGLYVRPIRIFLFVNVVLFVVMRGSNGTVLKGPLSSNFSALLYGHLAERMATVRAASWPGGSEAFARAFDRHAASLAPTLVATLIPALALVLMLNRPRGGGVRHLVLATHAVSALIASSALLMVALSVALSFARSLGWISPAVDSIDPVLLPLMAVLYALYFSWAIRRVYDRPRWTAAISGVLTGTLGFAFAFWIYRAVLFFVAMWTIDPPAGA